MKILKDLGSRYNGTRNYLWAEFECPKCKVSLIRMKHQGLAQAACPDCSRKSQIKAVTKHGDRDTRLYRTWINMRQRCYNSNSHNYSNYGGKGILVCPLWDSFSEFKLFALNNGYTDILTIDRKDNTKNYEPSNCVFITKSHNAGKDKIKISQELYIKMEDEIAHGASVSSVYTSRGLSMTAYYNAKERYDNNTPTVE